MLVSQVETVGGVPTLTVNGQPIAAAAYITYFCDQAHYRDFAAAGYRLFSVPIYFAGQSASNCVALPPDGRGVYDPIYQGRAPDYEAADRRIREILEVCPDGWIFPRLDISLPRAWELAHPQELCDTCAGGDPDERRRSCFSSRLWAEETTRLLEDFLTHSEQAPYADRVIGYQLAAGGCGEWYGFDYQGSVGPRSREAFARWCAETGAPADEPQYYRFLSQTAAHRLMEMAAVAKRCVGRRKIIGSFYGYTAESVEREHNHHALSAVLRCPDVDFLCAPVSYLNWRSTGQDNPNHTPVDSIKLHGKLYFAEQDVRTHLTKAPNAHPAFENGVWAPPPAEKAVEIMKLQASRALTHGHGFWWFDMWGGWFADPRYMAVAQRARELMEESLRLPRRSAAKAAVFVDEASFAYLPAGSRAGSSVVYQFRRILGLSSTPYDIYLADDFDAVYGQYAACVFLQPCPTEELSRHIRQAEAAGIPTLVVTPDNAWMEPQALLEFFRQAGAGTAADRPCVVYRSESYVFLHTAEEGVYAPDIPSGSLELFTGKRYTFPARLPAGTGYLFLTDENARKQ